MIFKPTLDQMKAIDLQSSTATHIMLYGGSRSGKTFINLRSIMIRAMAHKSRHAVLRFRFNHVKQSVVYDTLPKVMDICFPGVDAHCKLDKSDWFYQLPNGSEVWFGGLDDKERTEKILGQEYASIFLNECSQISWAARNMAITRLAQKTPLRLKTYYDCNPPPKGHWTYRLFIDGVSPDTRKPVPYADQHVAMLMNPDGNQENLAPGYLDQLRAMPERMRLRFLLGQFADDSDSSLWSVELLEQCRLSGELPDMLRIIIAVDPSGCSGDEDTRSDEVGIIVCGLGVDGKGYVLEDLSGRYGPSRWGAVVAQAFDRHEADRVVAETNFGGAMVGEIIRAARPGTPFTEVKASRGKAVRAEPVAALFDQGKIVMSGYFPELEDQLLAMTTTGYAGSRSPDRADALVWAIASLFPALTKRERDPIHVRTTQAVTSNSALKAKLRGKK